MRRFGRRSGRHGAVAATAVALALAATGTSLAAVRAARSEGGLAAAGVATPAPFPTPPPFGADPGPRLDPTAAPFAAGAADPFPAPPDPSAPGPFPPASATPGTLPMSPPAGTPVAAGPARSGPSAPGPLTRLPTLIPAAGPTPTLGSARRPTPTTGCPSDMGIGAAAPPVGPLQAVSFTLPWPGLGPLVLRPQTIATRPGGAAVRLSESSAGAVTDDGSSLTLLGPLATVYTVAAGSDAARGTIGFTVVGATAASALQACRGRSLVVHDVARRALEGRPLRIVGVVAPTGTVTVDASGGLARFRSDTPGVHAVALVTASDAGAAGPLITVTVTVP
ncbi:MAG: hypothetical protein ABIS47_01550 [Acidimicrobiales bacterium]